MIGGICEVLLEKKLIDEAGKAILRADEQKAQANPYLAAMVNFYVVNAKRLADRMTANGEDWDAVGVKAKACQALHDQGKTVESWMAFCTLIHDLVRKHWPDCSHSYWQVACGTFGQAKARLASGKRIDDGSRPAGVPTKSTPGDTLGYHMDEAT